MAELCVLALVERYLESAPIRIEADVGSFKVRRGIVTAHPADHDDRHRRDRRVTIPLVLDSMCHCEVHGFVPFKGLFPVFFTFKPNRFVDTLHTRHAAGDCVGLWLKRFLFW